MSLLSLSFDMGHGKEPWNYWECCVCPNVIRRCWHREVQEVIESAIRALKSPLQFNWSRETQRWEWVDPDVEIMLHLGWIAGFCAHLEEAVKDL